MRPYTLDLIMEVARMLLADVLKADPIPWLLEESDPAVRAATLTRLFGRPADDPEVRISRSKALQRGPIAETLAAQHPEGYWSVPGSGYGEKYRGSVWQVVFLDQLGADPDDERVRRGCDHVLAHTQASSGGFGVRYGTQAGPAPPSSAVIHCLNGNLLRALIGFGRLHDERVQRSVDWQARSITGEGFDRYYQSGTVGPGFCCAANDKLPCAWGAVKVMLALARIPVTERTPEVGRALQAGGEFLLSRDPAVADYPFPPSRASKPNGSWFKLGFPIGYVTDVLQNLEALCDLGCGSDPRLRPAVKWLLSKQDAKGRWKNEYAYSGKTWVDIDRQGEPSKWVTLRALAVVSSTSGLLQELPGPRTLSP